MSNLALCLGFGIALASATGFRTFLPMFIISGAVYFGQLHLDQNFAWLGTASARIMLSRFAFVPAEYTTGHEWRVRPRTHASDGALAGVTFAAGLRDA